MPTTPYKQPVAAEKGWVTVAYLGFGFDGYSNRYGNPPGVYWCAIRRGSSFETTVEEIMREGIWSENGEAYIPPTAIIGIRDRGA